MINFSNVCGQQSSLHIICTSQRLAIDSDCFNLGESKICNLVWVEVGEDIVKNDWLVLLIALIRPDKVIVNTIVQQCFTNRSLQRDAMSSKSIGESSTVVSAYTLYRHLQQYCSHPSK